jgi:hypothetical protein
MGLASWWVIVLGRIWPCQPVRTIEDLLTGILLDVYINYMRASRRRLVSLINHRPNHQRRGASDAVAVLYAVSTAPRREAVTRVGSERALNSSFGSFGPR